MNERTVDARGQLCPRPLILVKRALTEMQVGETVCVLLDNDLAKDNVLRFLRDNGAAPSCSAEGGVFRLQACKSRPDLASAQAESYCAPAGSPRPHVMALGHAGMGRGSEELGGILIQACLNAVKEVSPLPAAIVFYNSGVHLACEGSPVLSALSDLEAGGVRLLVCGTCLNYYEAKAKVRAGSVSNMYDIPQALASAGHVVSP
jgi:selenium metabolism protein YedF